jgi:hypothetical protein
MLAIKTATDTDAPAIASLIGQSFQKQGQALGSFGVKDEADIGFPARQGGRRGDRQRNTARTGARRRRGDACIFGRVALNPC